MGLEDRYHDVNNVSVSDSGWNGNIMSALVKNPDGTNYGNVQQRNIDEIIQNNLNLNQINSCSCSQ